MNDRRRAGRGLALALLAAALLGAAACSRASPLEGLWKGEGRSLSFRGPTFTIEYSGQTRVRAIRGGFSLEGRTATLSFKEYREEAGAWKSLEGTELAGQVEKMDVSVEGTRLRTVIQSSGKIYDYEKNGSE
jgi:hypothetical protein